MTGWIIFGCVVLFLIILFRQSITVTVDYENKLDVKVKFLFFTIYPTKPKKKKIKKEKAEKQKKQKKTTDTVTDDNAEASDSGEAAEAAADSSEGSDAAPEAAKKQKKAKKKFNLDIEMIMDYVESAWPPIKRLFKKIRWYDVYVDWVVASDDAAKTALQYGGICSFMYPFFKWLTTYFTAHIKEVNIEPDFSKEQQDIFIYFVLKLRLSTALACIIWLAWRVLKTYLRYNKDSSPAPKAKKKTRKVKKSKAVKKGN